MPRPPFDAQETQDLWFLPGPLEDAAPTDLPWRMAPSDTTPSASEWLRAEARLARPLAEAAEALGRLTGQLELAPEGTLERLVFEEISGLLRLEGTWIGPERLALHRAARLSTGDEGPDLARADWAVRRLLGGPGPEDDLAGFLGRPARRQDDMTERMLVAWQRDRAALDKAHPLTRAGFALWFWRSVGLAQRDAVLEPVVLAMRLMGCVLVPVAGGGRAALVAGGKAEVRLENWLTAVRTGALGAGLVLERLRLWEARAQAAIARFSGRTPPRLVVALRTHPVLTAEIAARNTGASTAACQRNLARFAELGLIRELTGQSRFRFWAAAL